MYNFFRLFCLVLAFLSPAGCGPKEMGSSLSSDQAEVGSGIMSEDQLRYPVIGAGNIERTLYYYNRPEVMAQQQLRRAQFNRLTGNAPDPEIPEYRAKPKQRSPFRQ
ncbi:chemotaxis protein [Candidatus Desulfovibrio trichonymphae]|nr:chemotaxis protein [Candidatus Desulfovibrio trichonymphae]GHU92419.1 hypothetical protein AGMMS49925_10710 [Deltaproteobacteria bacterium]GHU99217.1 hypothetical protein AGMMS50248_07000 [Deltaproteobacteria bacterium]